MPIAKLPDFRMALVFPVFCRRLPRDTAMLVREYVEDSAPRSFDNAWPDEVAFDEWKPGMELIVEFLGEEAWRSFGVTNHSVRVSLTCILLAMAESLFHPVVRPGSSDSEEEILSWSLPSPVTQVTPFDP